MKGQINLIDIKDFSEKNLINSCVFQLSLNQEDEKKDKENIGHKIPISKENNVTIQSINTHFIRKLCQ